MKPDAVAEALDLPDFHYRQRARLNLTLNLTQYSDTGKIEGRNPKSRQCRRACAVRVQQRG
jgi:hypothetical protein